MPAFTACVTMHRVASQAPNPRGCRDSKGSPGSGRAAFEPPYLQCSSVAPLAHLIHQADGGWPVILALG
jgi:hypothetical protein